MISKLIYFPKLRFKWNFFLLIGFMISFKKLEMDWIGSTFVVGRRRILHRQPVTGYSNTYIHISKYLFLLQMRTKNNSIKTLSQICPIILTAEMDYTNIFYRLTKSFTLSGHNIIILNLNFILIKTRPW